MTKKWWKAAGIRAIKTVAQTAVATIGTTAMFSQVDWLVVGSTALVADIEKIADAVASKGIANLENRLVAKNPTYNTVDEVPAYWRADIKELVDKGIISGVGGGKLGMTHSDCKAAVIAKRAIEKM